MPKDLSGLLSAKNQYDHSYLWHLLQYRQLGEDVSSHGCLPLLFCCLRLCILCAVTAVAQGT